MKKRPFIVTVLLANIAFILLQIDKHNRVTEQMYRKQKLEQKLAKMTKKCDQLKHEICNLKHHNTVKAYAQRYLKMQPLDLKQIKKLDAHA